MRFFCCCGVDGVRAYNSVSTVFCLCNFAKISFSKFTFSGIRNDCKLLIVNIVQLLLVMKLYVLESLQICL